MRATFVLPLILACGLAGAALAQPAAGPVQTVSTSTPAPAGELTQTPAQQKAQEQEQAAAQALAMSIRQRQIEEQRIARYACAAGDTSKCQAANADTTPKTPSP